MRRSGRQHKRSELEIDFLERCLWEKGSVDKFWLEKQLLGRNWGLLKNVCVQKSTDRALH